LLHSSLFGLASSVADLLFNFYLVSLGYSADTAGLLSTVNRMAGVALGLPIGLLIDRIGRGARWLLAWSATAAAGRWRSCRRAVGAGVDAVLVGAAQILALTSVVPLMPA